MNGFLIQQVKIWKHGGEAPPHPALEVLLSSGSPKSIENSRYVINIFSAITIKSERQSVKCDHMGGGP
jgi:hypothetical protein